MDIKFLSPNNHLENEKYINHAAKIIKSGGLVAFPTETVYGLGADGLNPEAVKKIFLAKGRPQDNPLILHIGEISMIYDIVEEMPKMAEILSKAFWPGPLTMVFKKKKTIPMETSGGLDTIAIRFPSNKTAISLIKKSGTPIAAPSANSSGKPSPTSAKHVEEDLSGKIDLILDGGETEFGLESTIVDITGERPCLLRPGSITIEMLEKVLGDLDIDPSITDGELNDLKPKAPGMKYTHYSPNADVKIIMGKNEDMCKIIYDYVISSTKKMGIMTTDKNLSYYKGLDCKVISLGNHKELETVGANLFSVLRMFDYYGVDEVFAEGFEEIGIGLAIMNRLKKSAGYNITYV